MVWWGAVCCVPRCVGSVCLHVVCMCVFKCVGCLCVCEGTMYSLLLSEPPMCGSLLWMQETADLLYHGSRAGALRDLVHGGDEELAVPRFDVYGQVRRASRAPRVVVGAFVVNACECL